MAYDLAKVTANGNNLIAQILANKSSLSIDKIEISDTQLPSTTDISTMTSVPKVVQTVSANGFSKNSNTLIISTVVDNSSIRADYKAWVFGIWGSDSQNGQSQLIAVITSTNSPDTIPAFSGSTPVSYTYKFNIGFSNASKIQFNMIDDSFATNDTVVHTTGDETIDGQKKFKTDPTDSAGNAYAKTVDVNQQLDKKVVDNKDGTEQLNGIQVQPYNKLSDVTSLRNIVLQTDNVTPYTAQGGVGETIQNFSLYSGFSSLPSGTQVYYSYDLVVKNADGGVHWYGWSSPWDAFVRNQHITTDGIHHFQGTTTIPDANINSSNGIHSTIDGSHATYQITNLMIVVGSIPVTHLPAPEDKQDKIAYTPADDSKVVHDNKDNTITANSLTYDLSKSGLTSLQLVNSGSFNDLPLGTVFAVATSMTNGPDTIHAFTTTTFYFNGWNPGRKAQIAIADNVNLMYFRVYMGLNWTSWTLLSDDSKVAHLSGANNFDTVPTVDNNPLLLASSLPSDLSRTGQAQTFTAAQTFSIAPVINDASTDKGDNQAATMADLKSVTNSAWRPVKLSDDAQNMNFSTAFYKKNDNAKEFTLIVMGEPSGAKSVFSTPKLFFTDHDIKVFTKLDTAYEGTFGGIYRDNSDPANELSIQLAIDGNSLMFTTSFVGGIGDSDPSNYSSLSWCGYQKFTGTYE